MKWNPYCFFYSQLKLILGKEHQCRPLAAQILPAHLAALAAAAISGSFTHRTNHGASPTPSSALFQTQTLPAALLRPAPGPVRNSHPQVLFAPYWAHRPRWKSSASKTKPCGVISASYYASDYGTSSRHVGMFPHLGYSFKAAEEWELLMLDLSLWSWLNKLPVPWLTPWTDLGLQYTVPQ